MTSILTANIGSYPRNGDEKDHQRHRRGVANFQNKEISAHAFRDVEQSVIQEVLLEQASAGLDQVTDGQISWNDPISHFTRTVSGIRTTGLRRYFDANFFYRVPLITGKPRKKDPFVRNEFIFSKQQTDKTIRAVLTGPLTLAHHTASELKSFTKLENRVKLFTDFLVDEIRQLQNAGCEFIQIDEPSILRNPALIKMMSQAFKALSAVKKTAAFTLAVYFGPVAPLYEQLLDLPIESLQMDFTYDGKKLWDVISKSSSEISLGLGLVNARQSHIEPIDPILSSLRNWISARSPKQVFITPSAGLEHLPRNVAFAKMKLLTKIKAESVVAYA